VRVDVGPYGGVSVRAPFAAVDVPPRGYYERSDVERRIPAFPSAGDLARMDDEQLDQALRSIAQSLHDRLNRFNTGDTWQRFLRLPDEIVNPATPHDERTAALTAHLDRFRKIAADPQYSMIAQLPAFVAMEAALSEALSRPETNRSRPGVTTEDLPLPPPQSPTDTKRGNSFLKPKPPQ
jgi:hypothetical protein